MKRPTQLTLVCTLATLLIACDNNQGTDTAASTPVPVVVHDETPFPAPGQLVIDLTPGQVSIRATEVNELVLLEQIAATADFDLLTSDILWSTVTVDIRADTLHDALTELLRAYPYQIVYTPDKDSQREILSEVFVSPDLAVKKTASPNKTTLADSALSEEEEEEEDEQPDPETQAKLQALKSESAETRAAAAADIEPTGAGLYALTDLITSDPSPEVRIASSRALEFSDDPLAIQALVACLKDEYPAVLLECITALEYIGDASTATQIQPMLEHYDAAVRDTAAQAIENLQ